VEFLKGRSKAQTLQGKGGLGGVRKTSRMRTTVVKRLNLEKKPGGGGGGGGKTKLEKSHQKPGGAPES